MSRPSAFVPAALGLPDDFLLTDYARLKGCSCKVPQKQLLRYLASADLGTVGVAQDLDCSIRELPVRGLGRDGEGERLFLVTSTDVFSPSVEDPYLQGEIAAANVVSDLCAIGVHRYDTMLMVLASSTDMSSEEREAVTVRMIKGFAEHCARAGVGVSGGQTIQNPWPLIGGVVSAVVTAEDMIPPTKLVVGDVLVLTKPLGTQMAVNARQWTSRPSPLFKQRLQDRSGLLGPDGVIAELYDAACESMRRLNVNAARLMHSCGAHGATDVTGFGLRAHAGNLASSQTTPMAIELHTLPIMKGAVVLSRLTDDVYRTLRGESAETSGGLLVALPPSAVEAFQRGLYEADGGAVSWIVGRVVAATTPAATLTADYAIVEV